MTTRDLLDQVLEHLAENRLPEILDFARFLSLQDDQEAWQEFGRQQLARAYGDDEPDYSLEDVKQELRQ